MKDRVLVITVFLVMFFCLGLDAHAQERTKLEETWQEAIETHQNREPEQVPSQEEVSSSAAHESSSLSTKVSIQGKFNLMDAVLLIASAAGKQISVGLGIEDHEINLAVSNETVSGVLSQILYPYGYGFRVDNDTIVILAQETRMFRLALPPVGQSLTTLTTNESLSGSRSGGGQDKESAENRGAVRVGTRVVVENHVEKLSFWDDVNEGIRILLSQSGKMSLNRTGGSVLVMDTPAVMAAIEKYIHEVNEQVSRQIMVNVKVLEVSLSSKHHLGIDWNALMERGDIKGLRAGSGNIPGNALSAGGIILSGSVSKLGSGTTETGVNAVMKALETYGKVEVVSQPRLAMINNTVANIQVGATRSYVASSNVETTQSGGTIVSGALGEVHGGVTLQIIGNIIKDDVYLNVTPVVSSIDTIRSISLGNGARLEAPETSIKSINSIVRLKAGETAVIGGLINQRIVKDKQSIPLLGRLPVIGRAFSYEARDRDRVELVVMISPRKE